MRAIFPEAWRDFAEHLPSGERDESAAEWQAREDDSDASLRDVMSSTRGKRR